jgi:hypothetical protein
VNVHFDVDEAVGIDLALAAALYAVVPKVHGLLIGSLPVRVLDYSLSYRENAQCSNHLSFAESPV